LWFGLETLWKRVSVVSMLVVLLRSTSSDRAHEEQTEYKADNRRLG